MERESVWDDDLPGEELGARLRTVRELRRLPLTRVADKAGISASFLSQLERGKTNASFGSLRQIAKVLGITLAELFDESAPSEVRVLKREDRPQLISGAARKYMLTQPPLQHLECFHGEFDPGASTGEDAYTHGDSQELLIVLRGEVWVDVDGTRHHLVAGDSIEYRSSQKHRTENSGDELAEVLWVVSPVTIED